MGIIINGQNDTIGPVDNTMSLLGTVSIGGTMTIEDFTNIDSVGLITARNGLQVTGGNVAIGHNDPSYMLHLKQYGNNEIVLNNTRGSSLGGLGQYDNHLEVSALSNHPLLLKTNSVERLRITSTGDMGLGTATPVERLAVVAEEDSSAVDNGLSIYRSVADDKVTINAQGGAANFIADGGSSYIPFRFYIHNGTTLYESLTIGPDGKVGISKTPSTYQFEVSGGSANTVASFESSDAISRILFKDNSGEAMVGAVGDELTFYTSTNATERLRITSGGSVAIGVNSPSDKLHVGGNNAFIRVDRPNGNPGLTLIYNSTNSTRADIDVTTGGDLRFATNNSAERLRITSAGIHKISTAGSTQDGTFFSTLTINNTGSNTYSRVRFDRSGVARFGLTLRNDDKLCISNLYQGGSVSANDAAFVMDAYSKIGINEASPTARLDINHPHTEQGLVVRSRYGNIATAMVKFDGDPDSNGGDGNVLHIHGGSSRTDSEILHIDSTGVGDIFDIRGDGLTRVYKQLQLEHSSNVAAIIFNEYGANDPKAQIEMDQVNGSSGQLIFRTQDSGTLSERLRITSGGDLVYDTNKGGIYNFDKACSANTSTNIFRIGNEHGAHCFTIYMTCSNSGNSVSKIYNVACQYGATPTINSAADTGGYSANNFSLTGSASGLQHTFAISVTGAAATISCTVVLGSMNTAATFTKL